MARSLLRSPGVREVARSIENMATQQITTIKDLTAGEQKQINAQRRAFMGFTDRFELVRESRAELAKPFMRLYSTLDAKYSGLSFVNYVRLYDPSVPTQARGENGYTAHRAYIAAEYLRRLFRQAPRGQSRVRDGAADDLARTIATILQVMPDHAAFWQAMSEELNLTSRRLTALKQRVAATRPLFAINLPRGTVARVGNVIHMERRQQPAQAGEPANAPARKSRAA